MKRECVFKIWHNGCWFYVYDCGEPKVWLKGRYRIYCGRRWIGRVAFNDEAPAIRTALRCALGEGLEKSIVCPL